MIKIYLIAGEASGDNIGAKLMQQIKKKNPEVEFYGIGGAEMQKQGIKLLFSANELSIMGFFEVVKHLPKILKKKQQAIEDIITIQPDVLVTIDSPGFCFRIAKAVKDRIKGKLVHYVAPSVWAYKPKRAKAIAKIYDKLLTILPFEADYFTKEGLDTHYVGYPPVECIKKSAKDLFRYKNGIETGKLLLCLAPGSRKQEIDMLLPIFLEASELLAKNTKKGLNIAIAAAEGAHNLIKNYTSQKDYEILIVSDKEKSELFSAADLAISKSGTITTELGLYGVPMVIAHKVNKLSYILIKSLIKIKYLSIINILANSKIIPELIQKDCNPVKISDELKLLLKSQHREAQLRGIAKSLEPLLSQKLKPSKIAADEILKIISN